jgi:hypothetical protein
MTHGQRIQALENEIIELKKIIKKDSLTLTDESNPNQAIAISFREGVLSTDKITTAITTEIENITNETNLN